MKERHFEGVPLLLLGLASAAFRLAEPWRIFEILPAIVVALRASLKNPGDQATWATAVPQWYGASTLAKRMRFMPGREPFKIIEIDMPATLKNQSLLDKQCNVGGSVSDAIRQAHVTVLILPEWLTTELLPCCSCRQSCGWPNFNLQNW